MSKEQAICPRCGSENVVPIRYGYPSEAMMEASREGRIALGGCMIHPDTPNRLCQACGHRWRLFTHVR